MNIGQAFEMGIKHHQSGRLVEAEALYRQILGREPEHADTLHLLGVLAHQTGRHDEAMGLIGQAIALVPDNPNYHSNLGKALADQGLAKEAIAEFRQAVHLDPGNANAHYNLGTVLSEEGRLEEAVSAYRLAIRHQPGNAEVYINLGNALRDMGQLEEAITVYRRALRHRPDYAMARNNIGHVLVLQGRLEDAIAEFRRAIQLEPDYANAHHNLGAALRDQGRLEEATVSFRQAVALQPKFAEAHSNLVYTLHFHSGHDAQSICQEHRRWNQQHAEPLRQFIRPHSNDRTPERRLRIGYVSPDFREHVVGYNILPLLSRHAPRDFEVFCYAQVTHPDALTDRFRASAHHWRNIVGRTDEQLAAQVREDRIDILVDLTLHMAHNRLRTFALKAAPVQVTFAGYPGSTGLSTIDYRLSDPYLDPPGMDESIYSEQTVRLAHSFWCYDPFDCGDIPVNALPADSNGFITFGCLNNFCKINDSMLCLWAKILHAVPFSRLMLLVRVESHRRHILELFRQEGIASQRIELIFFQPRRKYLELYHRMDLGLDTLPYNGHTTSLDSFWMGVPVVTLAGQTVVGRAGLCELMNLNLPELIASTAEQYVKIATELANDLPRLAHLRGTLRERMEQSPLMDAPSFVRNIEAVYREMWRKWCAKEE